MPLTLVQIDAFTDRPFRGNPAAVCLLTAARDDDFLQAVAREMNLSETAFLSRRDDGGFDLRWFTPAVEVELCGHATLASAHHLWQDGHLAGDETIRFHTLSGLLTAKQRDDGWIELDFPAQPVQEIGVLPGLAEALGEAPLYVGGNGSDLLVELASESIVRQRCPDLSALKRLPARGVMITARGEESADHDFVCRFFAPNVGVDEDPVTGSAHTALGPYWAKKLNKEHLLSYQASARGGQVKVQVEGDRVLLGGQAVTVMRAELTVD